MTLSNIFLGRSKYNWLFILPLIAIAVILKLVVFDKFLVFLVLLRCLQLGSRENYVINPFYLFCLTPFSLLIYVSVGEIYMIELEHETYLLALINMVAFVLALSFSSRRKRRIQVDTYSSLELVIHSFILFFISLTENLFPFIGSVLWIFSVPSIVCAIMSRKMIMFVLVALYITFNFYVNSSKLGVLLTLITLMVTFEKYFFKQIRKNYKNFFYLLIGIILMLFSFEYANKDGNRYDSAEGLNYYSEQGVDWSASASLFLPYMYFTTPWSNLQYVIKTQRENSYGLWLFKPILGYFQLDDYFESHYYLESYSSFNTFTFISCGYRDFGFWGSIWSSLFLGIFVNRVYLRYKASQSPFDVAIYICVTLAVVAMFFSNHFFMVSYPFTIIIVVELYIFSIVLFKNRKEIVNRN